MARKILAINTKVEVQKTLGSALVITALTRANPGVATVTGHGLTDGDVIVFAVGSGMVELDGQAVRVNVTGANSFQLDGLDTTAYSPWTSGTAKKVSAWSTMDSAQTISAPAPTPNKIDVTTLIDSSEQKIFGLPAAPDGSIQGLFNPGGEAEALIRAATKANGALVFRVTFGSGESVVFNANVSGGTGFDAQQGQIAKRTTAFTPIKDMMEYTGPVEAAGALSTKPKYGTGTALLQSNASGIATLFAALTEVSSATAGSRVAGSSGSPLTVSPAASNYGYFACLASAAPAGVTFNTALGPEGWNGAGLAGQNGGASPIPSTTVVTHTDAEGNLWNLYRQDLSNTAASFWTT